MANNEDHLFSLLNEKMNIESNDVIKKTNNITNENIKSATERLMKIVDLNFNEFIEKYHNVNENNNENQRRNYIKNEFIIENCDEIKNENKIIDNDLFCSDEKLSNKMEIEEQRKNSEKLSYFELKKQTILEEFINILKDIQK